ncbi:MAG: hypothetical protein QOC68_1246 [Solirubrobacteraceae bacterium]|nr:hypothetical protein [Solirubrobacteraceae bacterium]
MTTPLHSHRLACGFAAGVAALALAAPAASAHHARSNAVSTWNENAGKAAVAACISPVGPSPAEARLYAMTHVAIHDALNAIARRSRPYAYDARAGRGASPDAAVAAAARDVLVPVLHELSTLAPPECINAAVAGVEADYATALSALPDGRAKTRGVAVGRAAAAAILSLRSTDGAQALLVGDDQYPQGTLPGVYRFTPSTPFAFAPKLGKLTPFVLRDSSQFLPGPPHAVTDRRYTADFNQVKRLGGDDVTTPSARTPDQTEIAEFWLESSPLQWNRIARTVAKDTRLDSWEQARLFGLLNMAMTDGYIGSFQAKYTYNYWRPVTAIREAATDGNPDTVPDPDWTPLEVTPAIPDYDSGHAVEGGTAAKVLERFFGTDRVRFSACSTTLPEVASRCGDTETQVLRRYRSFSQAERENGRSRILIGFHFREAVEVGIVHGRHIADRAVNRFMGVAR